MNLYQITQEFQAAVDLFVDAGDEAVCDREVLPTLEDWLNETRDSLDKKRLAVGAYIKNQQAEIDAIKVAEKELEARRKRKESSVEWLKQSLLNSLLSTDTQKVEGVEFDIKLRLNNPAVVITDEAAIPEDYTHFKEVRSIDKKAIADDIKAGKEVPGAHLEQSKSLQIK
jgi:hypothetical protein